MLKKLLEKLENENQKKGMKASMFVPSHPKTSGINYEKDRIRFKNALQEIRNKLGKNSVLDERIEQVENKLLSDEFIKHQELTTAVFISKDYIETILLPIETEHAVSVAEEFMIEPLYLIQNLMIEAYVVDVNMDKPRLFFSTLNSIKEIDLDISSFSELLELDHEQNQQYHSLSNGNGSAMYHGHGAQSDQKQNDIDYYTAYASKKIAEAIGSNNRQLILLAGEKRISQNFARNLSMDNVDLINTGNIEHLNKTQVHSLVKEELKNHTSVTAEALKSSSQIVGGLKKSYKIIKEGRASDVFVPVLKNTTDTVRSGLEKRFVLSIPQSKEVLEAIRTAIKYGGNVFAVKHNEFKDLAVTARY